MGKTPTRRRPARGRRAPGTAASVPGPAPSAGRLMLDGLGRVTSDRVEAEGGHQRAYAPRHPAPRPVPRRPEPGDPGQPLARSVAERLSRYAIAGTGRLTSRQVSRLLRDWDRDPRDGESAADADTRAREELSRLAGLAWAEHVTAEQEAEQDRS